MRATLPIRLSQAMLQEIQVFWTRGGYKNRTEGVEALIRLGLSSQNAAPLLRRIGQAERHLRRAAAAFEVNDQPETATEVAQAGKVLRAELAAAAAWSADQQENTERP